MAKDMNEAPTAQPSIGLTSEQLRMILDSVGASAVTGMREAQKQARRENPNYPEQSVFHPEGKFDHEGKQLAPKVAFRIPTFFCGVRLRGETETAEEIMLCNKFTEPKTARKGRWTAELKGNEFDRELHIDVPCYTQNDKNDLPSFALILMELLEGADAVTPASLIKRIEELERKQTEAA